MHAALVDRFHFRYSLRTLLVVVTLAAVASWGYWVAWPWWQMRTQQVRLVRAVTNVRESLSIVNANSPVLPDSGPWKGGGWIYDASGNEFTIDRFEWPCESYFLVCQYTPPQSFKSLEKICAVNVEVFRVPPAPANYVGQTEGAAFSTSRRKKNIPLHMAWIFWHSSPATAKTTPASNMS